MKKSKRWISAVVAAVMTCSVAAVAMVGCGKKPEPEQKVYTYNEYISRFPSSWSTHNASSDADMYVQKYTEMGLYDYTFNDDRTSYKFVDEMATGDPVNVTSTYSGRYGITAADADNTKAGKAWEITLNPDATWENGTAITADDYVWSMDRLLSPEMKNNRATSYTAGETAIYNAGNYNASGYQEHYVDVMEKKVYTEDELLALVDQGVLYFSFETPLFDDPGARTLSGFHNIASQKKHFLNANGEDVYDILYNKYASTVNEFGYVKITRDNYEDFKTNLSVLAASALKIYIPNWYVLLTVKNVGASVYTKTLATTTYTDDEINTLVNDGQFYFSFDTPIGDNAGMRTLAQMHALTSMRKHFLNADGEDVYDILYNKYASHANEFGYIRISQRNIEDFKTNLSVISASALKAYVTNWYSLTSVRTFDEEKIGTTTFAEVGMFKTADNKFVMVFENALTQYQVKSALTSNWLVYKTYYEEGYSQHGSLKLTSYGTTSGKYMGYGPYKLDSYETDKQLIFVRNENWYGYKSDKKNYHANEYQTDRIVCKILADQATALLEFESGNLDNVVLSANDTDKYKFSDYLLKRSGSNTWSISINSDAEKLAALESDGNGNRRILSVPEFRKAISLSIDRSYIAQTVVAGATAAYTFINDNYYYDMENDPNSVYRNTAQAKKAVLALYGIEYGEGKRYATLDDAYKSVSGYDPDSAKKAFEAAYTKAKDAGLYNDGDNIRLTIYNTATSAKFTALVNYIQKTVNEATKGTPLQDKITVTTGVMQSGLGSALNQGKVEARYYSFAGDYANPNGMIANFTDSKANTIPECGFDPLTATFDVTADFNGDGEAETVTKTYDAWQKSIAAGGAYATASNDIKLEILSALEYNLLSGFRTLPLCVIADVTLRSKKVNYATENANIFVAYGGVRLMTYNYSDAEWANFCKDKNNLKYD